MIRTVAGRDGWWVIVEAEVLRRRYGPYRTQGDAAAWAAQLVDALGLA